MCPLNGSRKWRDVGTVMTLRQAFGGCVDSGNAKVETDTVLGFMKQCISSNCDGSEDNWQSLIRSRKGCSGKIYVVMGKKKETHTEQGRLPE